MGRTLNFRLDPPSWVSGRTLLGLVFLAAGGYCISVGEFKGFFLVVLGLLRVFLYQGFEFDLPRQRYRQYHAIFGLRLGAWEPLPPTVEVTLKYFSQLRTSGQAGLRRQDKDEQLLVMLSVPDSAKGVILHHFPLQSAPAANAFADALAAYLGVAVHQQVPARLVK
jgi:hypothetical protein